MRYVALTRLNLSSPVHLLGVGETFEAARIAAINWFDGAIDRGIVRGTNELLALQGRLTIMTEDDLLQQSGVGLDEWLLRAAVRGETLGATEAAATVAVEPVVSKDNRLITGLQDLALVLVLLIALPIGLTFWQLYHHGFVEIFSADIFFAALVFAIIGAIIVNAVRFVYFKMVFGFTLREYVACILLMQVFFRVLWEATGGNVWVGLLALLFV